MAGIAKLTTVAFSAISRQLFPATWMAAFMILGDFTLHLLNPMGAFRGSHWMVNFPVHHLLGPVEQVWQCPSVTETCLPLQPA